MKPIQYELNRLSSQNRKLSKLLVWAVALALVALVPASPAFASGPGQNGESSRYTVEMVGGSPLATRNNRAEARVGNTLLEVWRGANNNIVWMSLNNGDPFQVANTATLVAPTVVAAGGEFMVFHTGTDGHIYYTFVFPNGNVSGFWNAVPAQTTQMPVSAAPMGDGAQVYMVYRGFGSDTRIWGTWFDGVGGWSQAENINNGRATSGPSVSFVPESNSTGEGNIPFASRLIITAVGEDNNIWSTGQVVGAESWSPWTPILNQSRNLNRTLNTGGVAPGSQVFLAANQNTNGTQTFVMNALDTNQVPEYTTFTDTFVQLTDWTQDTTGFQTAQTPVPTTNGSSTYSLLTGKDGVGFWKQEYEK